MKKPATKQNMVKRLKRLSATMHNLGVDMDYYGGLAHWAKHGVELDAASLMVDEWVKEVEKEMEAK